MAEPSDFSSDLQRVFFHAKLLSTKREIEEYLDAECGVDSPDKQLILRMLDAGKQQLTSPLTAALGNARSTMELIEAAASEQSYVDGKRQDLPTIPRYDVVEFLGEGAMGRVYYAEQLEPIRRQVAIKVIKPGMDSAQVLARFEREKQTLAMLDHSNICEVYDAGTTERGYPYFSMELVSGDSIDRYSQANSLSIEDRIRLMLEVCRATHHAHKRGIVHRDLKPSNVLVKDVDDQPVVKVIDFGVAKALSSDLEDSGYQTYFKQLIGTPMYMSPEQVELGPKKIDERSDVYAIGAMLYRLVTGYEPIHRFEPTESRDESLQELIRTYTPPLASRKLTEAERTEPESLATRLGIEPSKLPAWRKQLRGDLETVLSIALEKDPERRYASAQALAEDLQKVLDRVPIAGTRTFRSPRFAAASAVLLTILILIGFATTFPLKAWQVAQTNGNIDPLGDDLPSTVAGETTETPRSFGNKEIDYVEAIRLQAMLKELENRDLCELGAIEVPKSPSGTYIGEDATKPGTKAPSLRRLLRSYDMLKPVVEMAFKSPLHDFVLSPNNRFLVAGYEDKFARIWDLNEGNLLAELPEHAGAVTAVLFSNDGDLLLTGDQEGVLTIWDSRPLKSGYKGETLPVIHRGEKQLTGIESLAFSPDNKLIAVGHRYDPVVIRNLDGAELSRIDLGDPYARNETILFSEDGQQIVLSNRGANRLEWWDFERKICTNQIQISSFPDWAIEYPREFVIVKDRVYCTEYYRRAVFSYKVSSGAFEGIGLAGAEQITSLAVSPDEDWLISTHKEGPVCAMPIGDGDFDSGRVLSRNCKFPLHMKEKDGGSVRCRVMSAENLLFTGGRDGTIAGWSLAGLFLAPSKRTLRNWNYYIFDDGKVCGIDLVGNETIATVFDPAQEVKQSKKLRLPECKVQFRESTLIAPHPLFAIHRGLKLIAMQTTKGIEVWSLVDGKRQALIELEDNSPIRLAWSQDGKVLAGAASTRLQIWKRDDDVAVFEKTHQLPISAINFDEVICQVEVGNDQKVVAIAWGTSFALWNIEDGIVLAEQNGEVIFDMEFNSSEHQLAVVGKGGTRLFDCRSGEVAYSSDDINGGLLQFVDCDRILLGRNIHGKIVGWHIPTKSSLEEIPIADRTGVVQDFRLTDKNRLVSIVWSESDPGYVRTSALGN